MRTDDLTAEHAYHENVEAPFFNHVPAVGHKLTREEHLFAGYFMDALNKNLEKALARPGACCMYENRTWGGGCANCGDPSY